MLRPPCRVLTDKRLSPTAQISSTSEYGWPRDRDTGQGPQPTGGSRRRRVCAAQRNTPFCSFRVIRVFRGFFPAPLRLRSSLRPLRPKQSAPRANSAKIPKRPQKPPSKMDQSSPFHFASQEIFLAADLFPPPCFTPLRTLQKPTICVQLS